jgi:hypothetical protein
MSTVNTYGLAQTAAPLDMLWSTLRWARSDGSSPGTSTAKRTTALARGPRTNAERLGKLLVNARIMHRADAELRHARRPRRAPGTDTAAETSSARWSRGS